VLRNSNRNVSPRSVSPVLGQLHYISVGLALNEFSSAYIELGKALLQPSKLSPKVDPSRGEIFPGFYEDSEKFAKFGHNESVCISTALCTWSRCVAKRYIHVKLRSAVT